MLYLQVQCDLYTKRARCLHSLRVPIVYFPTKTSVGMIRYTRALFGFIFVFRFNAGP